MPQLRQRPPPHSLLTPPYILPTVLPTLFCLPDKSTCSTCSYSQRLCIEPYTSQRTRNGTALSRPGASHPRPHPNSCFGLRWRWGESPTFAPRKMDLCGPRAAAHACICMIVLRCVVACRKTCGHAEGTSGCARRSVCTLCPFGLGQKHTFVYEQCSHFCTRL